MPTLPNAPWLRSLSARVVLLNTGISIVVTAAVIQMLCWLAAGFMHEHLDDNVLDEIRILESEFDVDGQRGVRLLIARRLAEDHDGRQAYLLQDPEGRVLAGNLTGLPTRAVRPGWYEQPTLHRPVDATMRLRMLQLGDGSRLVVGFDDHEVRVFVGALQRAAGVGLAITVLLGLVAGALSSRMTLRHLDVINRTAMRIIDGELARRMPLRGSNDEFDRLSATLNEMLDRIDVLMTSVKSATDSIAHDLRSPLARMRNRIEMALHAAPANATEQQALLEALCLELDRVLAVFASMLRLATIESGVLRSGFQSINLEPLADDAVRLYEALASERAIAMTFTGLPGHSPSLVNGDRDLLFQALCNLLDNAVKFSPDGAEIRVTLRREGQQLLLGIDDEGCGVPDGEHERVFDRLVRLESNRDSPGHGLGLSLVRAIARLHGGDCRIEPRAVGTRALLLLPSTG